MTCVNKQWKRAVLVQLLMLTIFLTLSAVLLTSCSDKCETVAYYSYYEPVYMPLDEFRSAVAIEAPKAIKNTGKIYFKDLFLFLNEPGKGIHVIDNRNPETPVKLNFISIPGNFEIAAIGNTLYADSYMDLLIFDLSNMDNIVVANRIEGIFDTWDQFGYPISSEQGILIDWVEHVDQSYSTNDCDIQYGPHWYWRDFGFAQEGNGVLTSTSLSAADVNRAAVATSGVNIGGSMARFAINQDHLYAIDEWQMIVLDINNRNSPSLQGNVPLEWGIETIFPYKDHLFLGAVNGMHIYNVQTPSNPQFVSTYRHINSCDPVVVQGEYAYVTLRSGTECDGFTNQLEIVNVSNLVAPKLEKTYEMLNPHGLGIANEKLFICEGEHGLKSFEITDHVNITQTNFFNDFHAFDVIPYNNVLMVTGDDGLYQYRYGTDQDLKFLSFMPVGDAL
jgi:hypothetical protein